MLVTRVLSPAGAQQKEFIDRRVFLDDHLGNQNMLLMANKSCSYSAAKAGLHSVPLGGWAHRGTAPVYPRVGV